MAGWLALRDSFACHCVQEFWQTAIAKVKAQYPDFQMMAEVRHYDHHHHDHHRMSMHPLSFTCYWLLHHTVLRLPYVLALLHDLGQLWL